MVCYIAGDGEIDKVNQYIIHKNVSNNVKLLGWIDSRQKIDLLKKVSTVILPSYNEGLPMSVLEGMAAGKAIISTPVGAIPEVIGCENGILCRPGDIPGLAMAIKTMLLNGKKTANMGKKNIQKISERYSIAVMHSRLGRYYELLLKDSQDK